MSDNTLKILKLILNEVEYLKKENENLKKNINNIIEDNIDKMVDDQKVYLEDKIEDKFKSIENKLSEMDDDIDTKYEELLSDISDLQYSHDRMDSENHDIFEELDNKFELYLSKKHVKDFLNSLSNEG